MKQKLLKPPLQDGATFYQPDLSMIRQLSRQATSTGVAHQPGFHHPGICFKFQVWQTLPAKDKKIVMVDTDKTALKCLLPGRGQTQQLTLVDSECIWRDYPNLTPEAWSDFLEQVEHSLTTLLPSESALRHPFFLRFKDILQKHWEQPLLKDVLTKTFLEYMDIQHPYQYVSAFFVKRSYHDFARLIYWESDFYRQTFNAALDEYRQRFRFRFKNFPFPPLDKDELPFWIVRNQQRQRCYRRDWEDAKEDFNIILPRASTLMLYLRLCHMGFFLHGIGGGNYEWIHDRLIERFFKMDPRPYAVLSQTQLITPYSSRTFPYFLFPKDGVVSHK
jgi:hypothetical protein